MNAAQVRSLYRRTLDQPVAIRRYSGVGPSRTSVDTACLANLSGDTAGVLVGSVMQYQFSAVILVEDLVAGGFPLPVTTADKLIFDGRELAIEFPDNATRRVSGELIAYELRVKG